MVIADLKEIGPMWYPQATVNKVGTRVMPYEFIEKHFNELSLAVLFMGDGSKRDSGYVLCVDNFTEKEVD